MLEDEFDVINDREEGAWKEKKEKSAAKMAETVQPTLQTHWLFPIANIGLRQS